MAIMPQRRRGRWRRGEFLSVRREIRVEPAAARSSGQRHGDGAAFNLIDTADFAQSCADGHPMNKAFTREIDRDDDDADDADDELAAPALPSGAKNYITDEGFRRLRDELKKLLDEERPKVVEVVSWAAKNGDRSENGDYLYGKKRLREIDRRIRFLTRRLDIAEIVDPSLHHGNEQIFFGATVRYASDHGDERTIRIIGVDEADSTHGEVSWIAPIARALLKARVGDEIRLVTPGGAETLEVLEVRYPPPG